MKRKEPPPELWLCLNPECRKRNTEKELSEIDWGAPGVTERMNRWPGQKPHRGCGRCFWPAVKLRRFIKDFAVAQELAEEGRERAIGRVSPEWIAGALSIVLEVAQRKEVLTSDDLYPQLGEIEHLNDGEPVNLSALGGVMVKASKEQWIAPTGLAKPGERIEHHRKHVRIWRSLVFGATSLGGEQIPLYGGAG